MIVLREKFDYAFIRKYSEYIALYKENKLPVVICDGELNAGWGNPAMETLYPHLVEKPGFDLLIGEFGKENLLKRLANEGSVWIGGLVGLSDIQLGLTPIIREGGLYGVVAELVSENSVILPQKARLTSQTPFHIEASIRESVTGMFRAMDLATQMEHLLLEKADLKKLGIDTGFISASYDSVSKHCYYLLRMAKNLSVFSGMTIEPPEPCLVSVDMFELILGYRDAAEALASEMNIPLEFSLPKRGVGLAGLDVEKFELAFFNILNNAFYFTKDGNTVTITLKSLKDAVSVTVCDHGAGIPNGTLPHIFNPYFSLGHGSKPAGIGLGLTIAKSMIEAQAGKITVKSVEGEGTSVTITIPRGFSAHRPTAIRADNKNPAADRFSYLYVGLVDAIRSPYNNKK